MLAFDPKSTYVCLAPDGAAASIDVTPDFWSTIDQRADQNKGRLVAVFESSADWPHWERHPEGEEVGYVCAAPKCIDDRAYRT